MEVPSRKTGAQDDRYLHARAPLPRLAQASIGRFCADAMARKSTQRAAPNYEAVKLRDLAAIGFAHRIYRFTGTIAIDNVVVSNGVIS